MAIIDKTKSIEEDIVRLKSLRHNLNFRNSEINGFMSIKHDLPELFQSDMKNTLGQNIKDMTETFVEMWNKSIDSFIHQQTSELNKLTKG